jgi:zinc transporter ZupT
MKKKNLKSEEKNKEKINENIEFTEESKYNSTEAISESNQDSIPNSLDTKTSQDFEKDTPFNKNTIANGPVNQNKKIFLSITLALVPIFVLTAMIYFLTSPYGQGLITGGIPLPEITIEKIEFHENEIVAYIRNTGPESVTISQADVNDRIHSAAIEPSQVLPRLGDAKVIIPFFWNPAEPYEVGITTSDGTRFSNTVEAAAPAPIPNINQVTIFALLGVFVGVIPVLIGLAWYPFMRKITRNQYNFFLSLTAGLLIFLGIEAFFESNEIAATSLAPVFNGQMLIPVVIIATFLGLFFLSEYFIKKAESKVSTATTTATTTANSARSSVMDSKSVENEGDEGKKPVLVSNKEGSKKYLPSEKNLLSPIQKNEEYSSNSNVINNNSSNINLLKPLAISLMVAIGIGLHNFGEGLAIGAAVLLGEIALSTFLIIGFTIHNTTEGLAIVAPLAKSGKLMIRRLILLGLIAGIPTILGTWIGGFIYSPLASVIFLAIGAGAIFQVVYSLIVWMSKSFKQSIYNQTAATSSIKEGRKPYTSKPSSEFIQKSVSSNSGVSIIAGFIIGMLIMYLTGLFV